MNILFWVELTHQGGVDTFLRTLLQHWPAAEDELHVLTNRSHPGLPALQAALAGRATVTSHGIPLYVDRVIDAAATGRGIVLPVRIVRRLHDAWRGFRSICALFRQSDFDRLVVVSGGYPGGDSGRLAVLAWAKVFPHKCRALFNVHNLAVRLPSWNLFEARVDQLLVRHAAQFVAVSRACAESLEQRPAVWASGKVSWVLNGIEAVTADPAAIRQQYGWPAETPLVLILATFEPRKGHAMLLEAFAEVVKAVPAARLLACGQAYPEDLKRLEADRRRLGLENKVVFAGFHPQPAALLAAADVLAVPTQDFESFGLVAAEAMSMKIPVVSTRVGGLPEVVFHGEGGYVVEPQDKLAFARAIAALLLDPALRRQQGELGYRRYCENFTADRMARDYAQLVHDLPADSPSNRTKRNAE